MAQTSGAISPFFVRVNMPDYNTERNKRICCSFQPVERKDPNLVYDRRTVEPMVFSSSGGLRCRTSTRVMLRLFRFRVVETSVSQPPGRGPVPGPGINYSGPREVLLEFVILVF
jgi:hypothetical protein